MTIGTARQGVSDPTPPRFRFSWRPGACAEYGHPGATFHPQLDRTWCQCGELVRDGDHLDWDHKHPASPLREWWDEDARTETIRADVAYGLAMPDYIKEDPS